MQREILWIRGGTIVTAYGLREADVWIERGKIRRVGKDTLEKRWPEEIGRCLQVFDATGMYLLPGFLALPEYPLARQHDVHHYLDSIRKLVRNGYTFVLDTLYLEEWMDETQVFYHQTPHYNNLIDYGMSIGIEADDFRPERIRSLCRSGFRLYQLVLWKAGELERINWEELSPLISRYRLSVRLHIPANARFTAEERHETERLWLRSCRRNKLRTWVRSSGPVGHAQSEPYYQLHRVEGDACRLAMESLGREWYRSLPVLATLTDVVADTRKFGWDPEQLLCLLVRIASTNVAKAIGLYPIKGSMIPGADADIVFVKKDDWLTKFSLSTILKFSENILPTSVMSNGKWVFREETFTPTIGMGRCLLDVKPYNYVI